MFAGGMKPVLEEMKLNSLCMGQTPTTVSVLKKRLKLTKRLKLPKRNRSNRNPAEATPRRYFLNYARDKHPRP